MMANLNQNHLLEEFDCKKPCQYMEYQFSGEPMNIHDQSSTKLQIMFDSHSVTVNKEVEAVEEEPFVSFAIIGNRKIGNW